MEVNLTDLPNDSHELAAGLELPEDYFWVKWSDLDLDRHAMVKNRSFRDEIDSEVFSSLGEYFGCQRLMWEITHQKGFVPQATWLIVHQSEEGFVADCGTIQGITQSNGLGSIQNVGVVPECRGLGLGRALVLKSLVGFRDAGFNRVTLEVTANNYSAVKLYRSLGFRPIKTMYRSAPIEEYSR